MAGSAARTTPWAAFLQEEAEVSRTPCSLAAVCTLADPGTHRWCVPEEWVSNEVGQSVMGDEQPDNGTEDGLHPQVLHHSSMVDSEGEVGDIGHKHPCSGSSGEEVHHSQVFWRLVAHHTLEWTHKQGAQRGEGEHQTETEALSQVEAEESGIAAVDLKNHWWHRTGKAGVTAEQADKHCKTHSSLKTAWSYDEMMSWGREDRMR